MKNIINEEELKEEAIKLHKYFAKRKLRRIDAVLICDTYKKAMESFTTFQAGNDFLKENYE